MAHALVWSHARALGVSSGYAPAAITRRPAPIATKPRPPTITRSEAAHAPSAVTATHAVSSAPSGAPIDWATACAIAAAASAALQSAIAE